ncbi:MAG TPA: hypothetical protein GX745_00260, partial [Clostridiales bacterium]|nr:hypothetical protein [Clostridiales bacterium]
MKKTSKKLLGLTLSLLMAFGLFLATPNKTAQAGDSTTQQAYTLDMVNAIVAQGAQDGVFSAKIEGELFDYQIGYGKVSDDTFKFYNTGANNKLSTNDNEGIKSGQYPACVWFDGSQNMLRTNNAQFVIFKLYINKDLTLNIEHDSVSLTESGKDGLALMFANIYKEIGGTPTLLQSKKIYDKDTATTEGVIDANAYGGVFE